MKVKCVKLKMPPSNQKSRIINRDMTGYLNIGNEFVVYGLRFSNEVLYVCIFADKQLSGHLVEVPIEMFKVIDGRTSRFWELRIENDGDITLWPELFYREWFFDDFSDFDEKLREEFKNLRTIMDRENELIN